MFSIKIKRTLKLDVVKYIINSRLRLDIAIRTYVIASSAQSDTVPLASDSFCHLVSKKLPTLSLYCWFMGAFTSYMPEIGSSSLSRDREAAGIDRHRDAANRLQSCRNHLAIRFGSFVGNGNSNNHVVLEC